MRFFISDLHLGDKNILKTENRPFCDVDEMFEVLIEKWNSVVKPEDEVFVVGDIVGLRPCSNDEIKDFFNRVNGKVTVVAGNHDKGIIDFLRSIGLVVYEYPIFLDNFWIVSHEPMYLMNKGPYANIFGHVHGNPMYKKVSNRSFCVCVERNNYTPVSFDEIYQKVLEEDYKDD